MNLVPELKLTMRDFKGDEGIKHVVKLLAGPFPDTGTGVLPVDKIDPKDKPFTRFYLEYCEEGNLFGLLKEYMQ